jgi:hypothetical protein
MHAGRVSAVVALTVLAVVGFAVTGRGDSQDKKTPASASSAETFVGVWHATLPNGWRAGAITVVPAGGGVGGAFIGYDYGRPLDPGSPPEGDPPKVSIRTGGVLTNASIDGKTLTFAMQLRMTTPPPGAPEHFEIRGEMRAEPDGSGELKLFSPRKSEPLTLRLTRE